MFNFKLKTILEVRKTLEDKVLQEFSQKQKELEKESERLESIQRQKMALVDELRTVQGKTVNISEIRTNAEYIKQCLKSEALQQEQVKEAAKTRDIKKKDLFDAIKKRKCMEILKMRQFNKHQYDLNLIERTAIDEMVLVRHNRKKEG
jgi:flagellar export protein FliJ